MGEKITDAAAVGAGVVTGGTATAGYLAAKKAAKEALELATRKAAKELAAQKLKNELAKNKLLDNLAKSKRNREASNFDKYVKQERKVILNSKVEKLADDRLKKLENSISGSHFRSKHGSQTTLNQQR